MVFHADGPKIKKKKKKARGTNSGKSGAMNLKAEGIRSRAVTWCFTPSQPEQSGEYGRCIKLKTVTGIRQGSAHMHLQQTILLNEPVILADPPCPQYIIFYNLTLKQVLFQAADFAQFLEHTVNSVRYILLKHPVVG